MRENMTTNPRGRRRVRTRQAILDAALDLIRDEGPAGLNMRTLAERTDYSAAALYEYFGSKDEIIVEVRRQGYDLLTAEMAAVDAPTASSAAPAVDHLLELGRAYIRFALANPDHFLLMFTDAPPGPGSDFSPEMLMQGHSSYHILVRAIQRGIEEGVFRPRPGFGLVEMAYGAWAIVHGLAMLRVTSLRGFPIDFDAADREALQAFVRGLQG
jgi:AcrR family transcriptional regulator